MTNNGCVIESERYLKIQHYKRKYLEKACVFTVSVK